MYLNLFEGKFYFVCFALKILQVSHAVSPDYFLNKHLNFSGKIINHVDGLGKELGPH